VKKTVQITDDEADIIESACEAKNARKAEIRARMKELQNEEVAADIKYTLRLLKVIRKHGLENVPPDFACQVTNENGLPVRPCVFTYDDGAPEAPGSKTPLSAKANGVNRVAEPKGM
jgi:hypothetical protein